MRDDPRPHREPAGLREQAAPRRERAGAPGTGSRSLGRRPPGGSRPRVLDGLEPSHLRAGTPATGAARTFHPGAAAGAR